MIGKVASHPITYERHDELLLFEEENHEMTKHAATFCYYPSTDSSHPIGDDVGLCHTMTSIDLRGTRTDRQGDFLIYLI